MPTPELINLQTRNQILLERLKVGAHAAFQPFLRLLDAFYKSRIEREGEFIVTRRDYLKLSTDIRKFQIKTYGKYNDELLALLDDLAIDQSVMEAASFTAVFENVTAIVPTPEAAVRAIRNGPMSIVNHSGVPLLEPFIRDYTQTQMQLVQTSILQGYSQNQTVSQIVRKIRGTKKNNFRDGDLDKVNRNNSRLAHTTIQHASSQARAETWRANADILTGYTFIATLDSLTSDICIGLDQRSFEIDKGPLPPMHVSCRSGTVPDVDKRFNLVDIPGNRPSIGADGVAILGGDVSYPEWILTQPVKFQETAIGVTQSKLLRDGGLSPEEYQRLRLGKDFQPLTLDEMRIVNPLVFERAGL